MTFSERFKRLPRNPRYDRAREYARKFIDSANIRELPADPFSYYKEKKWLLHTCDVAYSIFASPYFKRSHFVETNTDAISYKLGKYYITVYDDQKPFDRIRWTLAHEIGHIFMSHLDDYEETQLCRGGLSNEQYRVLEQEAHTFAGEILRPPILLTLIQKENVEDIQSVCNVSFQAATVGYHQIKSVKKFMYKAYVSKITDFFSSQFYDFIHRKVCAKCKNYFIIANAKYCPVCGNSLITWEGRDRMVYDCHELDDSSKARVCPKCENEMITSDGSYCQICGSHLINKCCGKEWYDPDGDPHFDKPCEAFLDGDARYCPYCGAETTFGKDGLLKPWREEYNSKKGLPEPDIEIPF
jgi:Zn-dependent peptidase ImmA (M78 family)/RNA polymerase subunit RPABC4/transcription elongation factor Spt4